MVTKIQKNTPSVQFLRKNHIQGSAWGSVYAGGGQRGWCQDNEIIGDLVRDFGK